MIKGFWKKLNKPFFALAPMTDVTDPAFRQIIAKYGKPDVTFTEFVSCDGLCSAGKKAILPLMKFTEAERPIVVQFFGSKPENFYKSAQLAQELGFDGIDINMGCPQKNIERQGAGAKLMLDPELAKKIIKETKRGASKLSVSVKTRLGYNKNIIEEWTKHLLETELAAITIHGRTRNEMSLVPADWESIGRAVQIAKDSKTLIIGNGDVANLDDGKNKAKKYGVDGVMIGRAVFGNPWFFSKRSRAPLIDEKMRVLLEHTFLFEEMFSCPARPEQNRGKSAERLTDNLGYKHRSFDLMKKHYKSYIGSFPGAKALRTKLMNAKNANEVKEIVEEFLNSIKGDKTVAL